MRYLIISVSLLILAACTPADALYTTKTANAMIDLQLEYGRTSLFLDAQLQQLPQKAQDELWVIKTRADHLAAEVRAAWRSGQLTTDRMDTFYFSGSLIYSDALTVINEHWDELTPAAQLAIEQIQVYAVQVDQNYQKAKEEQETSDLLKAGVEMATLALRLGMVLL